MAATKDLLTVETEHNGDSSDYNHSDMDDNYDRTLESKYSKLGKNDSLKSTRSLSVFRDPNASKEMARSEEVTYNIYEDVDEGGGGETTPMDAKAGRMYSKSSNASLPRGTFQMKTATSSTSVPPMTSDSLHNSDFKASLANTLTRRQSGEGSGSESKHNGYSHLVSMDPGGRSSSKGGASSVSSKPESTGSKAARKDQWNSLSSAASSSTLTSVDGGVGASADLRGAKPSVDLSQSEAETDIDHSISGRRGGGYSSDQDSDVVSHSLPRYSPAEIDVSNSKVKDKDFKAKMSALFGGSGTTSPVSTSAPASLVRSKKGVERLGSSDNDAESRTSTLSRDLLEVSTPAASLHSTLEGRTSDAHSQRSTTPSDLQDVITQGKVNRLAGELAIRGVPLTGRSMDASSVSSMERQPSRAASNQSETRDQSKTFKYAGEGIDRPSESETNTTLESEDSGRMGQKRQMHMNLLQEIRNRGGDTVELSKNSGDGGVAQSDGVSSSGDGGVQSDGVSPSKDGESPSFKQNKSPDLVSRETITTTTKTTTSSSMASTSAGQSNDGSVEKNIDERSTPQSESADETDATLEEEEEEPPLIRSSVGFNSAQMAGRSDDREGTSVSVEITDGSETGHSNNLDDAAISRRDDEPRIQDKHDSTTDYQQPIGQHVVTLHLTGDNDIESNVTRSLSVEKEGTDAAVRKDKLELNQVEHSSRESAEDIEQRPLRHRMAAADRINHISNRSLPGDEPIRTEERVVGLSQRNTRDGTLDDEESESQLTEGSDYSGRQRAMFGGRPKINHKISNESASTESYLPVETQRSRIAGQDTGGVGGGGGFVSNSHSIDSQRPSGRKVVITGRDNIRRITPMNDLDTTVIQEGIDRRGIGIELSDDSGGHPHPSPRKSLVSDVQNAAGVSRDRSPSFDRQVTSESGGHISLSSDDLPEERTATTPVWTHPHELDPGTTRNGNSGRGGGGLVIRLSPDQDASLNSRRSLTDSERGRQGLYEQNRRRSRQRKPSRQVTDSSLTDQEDFENAGSRSSVMRRRMKRHMSRLSVESDTEEDPATIYSEPEYSQRETHITQTSTTPVTGLISYGRSSSRPILDSEITRRSPSVPPPSAHFRPSSVVQKSHRSVTPVTGRISVSRTNSKPNLSRSATPVTGLISVQNGSRPRSAMDSVPINYHSVANSSNLAYPLNGSRPRSALDSFPMNYPIITDSQNMAYPPNSPTGNSSYLRSVNVVSPDSAEVIGVDPELRDAQKTGNIYHITMSLRPIVSMSRPGSAVQAFELVDTAIRSVPRRAQSIISNGPRTSWLLTEDDIGFPNQSARPPSSVHLSPNQRSSPGHASQNPVAFHLELQGGETVQKHGGVSSHPTSQGVTNDGEPSFVVDLGQSIDLTHESAIDDGPGSRRHSEKMPNIVRGSILIKNTFDSTNPPQVVDVVDMDDGDDYDAVEDNINMFHGKYMSRKENPLYSSNPDLNRVDDDDDADSFQAEFVPAVVDEPDTSPTRTTIDRSGLGKGVMGARPTGNQRPLIPDKTQSSDYVGPEELEFESLPNGNTTSTRNTINTTTDARNRRVGSGYVDDFDRDVIVTRDQNDRSKTSLVHGGYFGQMENGEVSGSVTMNGGRSISAMNGGGSMSGASMSRTSQFSTSASRAARDQHGTHDPYSDGDFNTEVKVNRGQLTAVQKDILSFHEIVLINADILRIKKENVNCRWMNGGMGMGDGWSEGIR